MTALTMCWAGVFFRVTMTLGLAVQSLKATCSQLLRASYTILSKVLTLLFSMAQVVGRPYWVTLSMAWTIALSLTWIGSMGRGKECLRFLAIVFCSLASTTRVTSLPNESVLIWILASSWDSVRKL